MKFESSDDYFDNKKSIKEDVSNWYDLSDKLVNLINLGKLKFSFDAIKNWIKSNFNFNDETAKEATDSFMSNFSMNESKLKEIRSLVQINIYWNGKNSFSMNWPGGNKVFNGSPEGFAKFLRRIGAKESSSYPRSERYKTYSQIVDDIVTAKDPNVYCWSNILADIPERILNENFLLKDLKESYKVKTRGD
jgi:hypothetical protein